MNIPATHSPRRQATRRREIAVCCLLAGLLIPLTLARAQTPGAKASQARTSAAAPARGQDQQPDLLAFNVWAGRFAKAQGAAARTTEPDAATLAEGIRLAEVRRSVLAALVYTDPARALAAGVPEGVRARLPAGVLSRLETPFSTVGDFTVDGQSGRREITIDHRTYQAHVSGQQVASTSGSGIALRGFTLDGEAVLDSTEPQVRRGPRPQVVYGNDFFSGALQLVGNSGSVDDDNIGASKEFGEPDHAGSPGGASVWYVWTPTSSGLATFSTDDNVDNFTVDTLLAVYTGTDVADLTTVASNDDYLGYNSQVTFYAVAGRTYHIAVDGFLYSYGPSEGAFTLFYFQQGNPLAPSITSDSTVDAQANTLFTYTITATNNPTSFSVSNLPDGLSFDPTTGVITGSVSEIGRYTVLISATNDLGTSTIRLTVNVGVLPVHLPFFRTEIALPQSPGFYYLRLVQGNIFGYYAYLADTNFIYHLDLGFEYTFDARDGVGGIFFYDFASNSYFYTSPRFPFPYLYDFSLDTFLYLFPDPLNPARYNTGGVRYFYNFSTGQIITK